MIDVAEATGWVHALIHDFKAALYAALSKWRECRALRAGACPDGEPTIPF